MAISLQTQYAFANLKMCSFLTFNYNHFCSITIGHASLIGRLYRLLLGVAYRTKRCSLCELGYLSTDHDCRLNHEGSAKSMEPSMAVELINSSLLKEQNVQISTFIGDDDCSTIAAIRRESGRVLTKSCQI